MIKKRRLTLICMFFMLTAVVLMKPVATDAAEEKTEQVAVKYFDADTDEVIYSEMKSIDEVSSDYFTYEPPYIFQNEEGESYTLDTQNWKNRFVIIPSLIIRSDVRGEYEPFCVYYKKGIPEQNKTAVKIRMFIRKSETRLINVKYVDQLLVGESFIYEPDLQFETGMSLLHGGYYRFDSDAPENQLGIERLSEDVNENVLNVYYEQWSYPLKVRIGHECRDARTGELLQEYIMSGVDGKYFEAEPKPVITAKDGTVYVFDQTDTRNVLNTNQMAEKEIWHIEMYYRKQIEIRFDAGGGTCVSNTGFYQSGKIIDALPVPVREGYLFAGWYTQETGGTRVKEGDTVQFDQNQTLYARYTPAAVTSDNQKNDAVGIKLKRVKITKALAKKDGKLELKWKKMADADGYQICYAPNAKFKKTVRKETTGKKYMLKKLQKGKLYFVKVRAYKLDSTGKKVYGAFSKIKKVKIG